MVRKEKTFRTTETNITVKKIKKLQLLLNSLQKSIKLEK